jgi:chromosome segregation ATPase
MTDSTPSSVPGLPLDRDDSTIHAASLDELRVALVLQREADEMIAEALETRRSAVERAAALVREAEQTAARAEADAASAAAQRIAAAREQADRILAEAQDPDQIASDAHADITALRHDAADLRDSAQETLEAAGLELERARQATENRERQVLAVLAEAIRTFEHLEGVTASLDDVLARVRDEVAAARSDFARLHSDFAAAHANATAGSVVLQWPHPGTHAAQDPATADGEEATPTSKHRRIDAGSRRGRLRKGRP